MLPTYFCQSNLELGRKGEWGRNESVETLYPSLCCSVPFFLFKFRAGGVPEVAGTPLDKERTTFGGHCARGSHI